jgi:hypothetical protein
MSKKSKKTIGIGILSWKAHETLIKSLESYPDDFLSTFDQRMIYFSDLSEDDKKIAKDYGWNYAGGPNEGIAAGMKNLAKAMASDYVLLLQNDNPLCEDPEFAIGHIQNAFKMLEEGKADLARIRHRWMVGEGFADVAKYLKYYDVQNISANYIPTEHDNPSVKPASLKKYIRRMIKPYNAKRFQGRSIFIEEKPEEIYPDTIKRDGDFLIIDSAVLDFTDQCLLINRRKWLDVFMAYVDAHPASTRSANNFQAPELCINGPWWRKGGFKILQGQGVFTHARYDGSFRRNHHTKKLSKTA